MHTNQPILQQACHIVFLIALIFLAVCLLLCLLRAIKGPRVADRIVAANMMGTMVMVIIGILSLFLGEGYLMDICIIYALISFLAVIVLTKVYTGVYLEAREQAQASQKEAADSGNQPNCQQEDLK